jgi:hypothetical protein
MIYERVYRNIPENKLLAEDMLVDRPLSARSKLEEWFK